MIFWNQVVDCWFLTDARLFLQLCDFDLWWPDWERPLFDRLGDIKVLVKFHG